jgi:hypothetical protein
MMRCAVFFLLLGLFFPGDSDAETFLGVPVIPQAQKILETHSRLELKTHLSHDDVVRFYKESLKGFQDIKFREWKDATYIEDDGNMPWHSITISKGDPKETAVTIVKDNWTWIIGTLILRFIGVFVVLLVLFVALSASGRIVSRFVEKLDRKKRY